jgi:hypothetical protein
MKNTFNLVFSPLQKDFKDNASNIRGGIHSQLEKLGASYTSLLFAFAVFFFFFCTLVSDTG